MRDLERVRQNQQRSRQRKRAYVLELEAKVEQLSAQLEQTSRRAAPPSEGSGNQSTLQALARLRCENVARHDLLLALGVTTSAQDLFVRASTIRMEAPRNVVNNVDIPPSPALASLVAQDGPVARSAVTDAGLPFNLCPGDLELSAPPSSEAESAGSAIMNCPDVARSYLDTGHDGQSMAALPATQSSDVLASVATFPSNCERFVDWNQPVTTFDRLVAASPYPSQATQLPFEPTPSLEFFEPTGSDTSDGSAQRQVSCTGQWDATAQVNHENLSGTTACSIAFSMILRHNARCLPLMQLESRLQVGYCAGETIGGDCRIANSVLFSVLAEIS